MLTTTDVQNLLGRCESSIRKDLAAGKLECDRHGGAWMFTPEQIRDYRNTTGASYAACGAHIRGLLDDGRIDPPRAGAEISLLLQTAEDVAIYGLQPGEGCEARKAVALAWLTEAAELATEAEARAWLNDCPATILFGAVGDLLRGIEAAPEVCDAWGAHYHVLHVRTRQADLDLSYTRRYDARLKEIEPLRGSLLGQEPEADE